MKVPHDWQHNPTAWQEIHDTVKAAHFEPGIDKAIEDIALQVYKAAEGDPLALKQAKQVVADYIKQRGSFSMRPLPSGASSPISNLADSLDKALNKSPEQQLSENILREGGGSLARKHEQVLAALEDHIKRHDGDGERELRQFMDAGEGKPGAKFLSLPDQALANQLHQMFQERWQKLKDLDLISKKIKVKNASGKEVTIDNVGIENYLKHLFVSPSGQNIASRILFGKRPLEGTATFMRHRFYDYLSDGLDHGLEPVTYNPIRMQLMGLFEIDRYIMAHESFNGLKERDLVRWFKIGDTPPEGWSRIDDKLFNPKFPAEAGLTQAGSYWAPADAAKTFNNYLSPGLRGKAWYDITRKYGNFLNRAQLSWSAFHATFEVFNSTMSDVALGLQKGVNDREFGAMFKHFIRSPIAAAHYYKLGKMIEQEYVKPGNRSDYHVLRLEAAAKAMEIAGGRIGLDPM